MVILKFHLFFKNLYIKMSIIKEIHQKLIKREISVEELVKEKIKIGDVVAYNLLEKGINLIATSSIDINEN